MQVIETLTITDWFAPLASEQQMRAIEAIENGKIIFLPQLPFNLTNLEQRFLSPHYVDPKTKNISYDIRAHTIRGVQGSPNDKEQMQAMMKRFAMQARSLVTQLLPHYQNTLQQARTSFRPVEISNRKTSYRKDDKRLHVDAFPANPNQGKRILRVFSNVNPNGEDRVWRVGEPFAEVARQFLPKISNPLPGSAKLLHLLNITKSQRTYYDHIMLQIHDRMKADENYQQNAQQCEVRFPPYTTWIVQTDQVSHAAMSGQYLFEQTFYLPVNAMQDPNRSPLRILEQMVGHALV
jgi:hypothetical protein